MSETVIPIASMPSTRGDGCCAWNWGTARTSSSNQTAHALRNRCGRRTGFMCRFTRELRRFVPASDSVRTLVRDSQAFHQVVSDSKCIGHDGECRIHGGARREETPVDYVEVVNVVRLAVRE